MDKDTVSRILGGALLLSAVAATHLASLLNEEPEPIFLLGAGASAKSGIPLSGELVDRIGKWSYCRAHNRSFEDPSLMRSDWWPWVQQQSWFNANIPLADNYPKAVDAMLRPQANRKAFFQKILHPHLPVSSGYIALSRMLARKVIRTVLTTNFDSLLATAARSLAEIHAVEEIKTPDDFRILSSAPQFPQIVYLHGSVEHYTDQNIEKETQVLHPRLVELLTPLLRDHPLVVIGYRGSEPSVMKTLLFAQREACMRFRHGIYWCHREGAAVEQTPLVKELAETIAPNLQFVPISGFDELMGQLDLSSKGIRRISTPGINNLVPDVHDLRASSSALQELDQPLLRAKLSAYAAAFPTPSFDLSTDAGLLAAMADRNIVLKIPSKFVPTNGGLLLFGTSLASHMPRARLRVKIKGPKSWVDEILSRPDETKSGDGEEEITIEGNLWSQLQVVSDLLARVNVPFRLKGPTSKDVYPYPPLALKELVTNLLAHRDYSAEVESEITVDRAHIEFRNPGGLIAHVRAQLDDRPIQEVAGAEGRGIKGYRNPVVADFFFAAGAMDKEGSGLPDVIAECHSNANEVAFGPNESNSAFSATIRCRPEALEVDQATRTARPKLGEQRYVPNLLSIVEWPPMVWKLATIASVKEVGQVSSLAPTVPFCVFRDWIWTFTDPSSPAAKPLVEASISEEIHKVDVAALFTSDGPGLSLTRILNAALSSHMRSLGLRVRHEAGRLRAYFPAEKGQPKAVSYRGLFKQATRTVSKPIVSAATGAIRYWEHKAVTCRFENFGDRWALSLVPGYIFTEDGDETSVPVERIGPLSTRRASRDYNPTVLFDLVFWSRVLANGSEPNFAIAVSPNAAETQHVIRLASIVPTYALPEAVDVQDEIAEELEPSAEEKNELDADIEEAIQEALEAQARSDAPSDS